jgi:N4-gp56 family major capsid protein
MSFTAVPTGDVFSPQKIRAEERFHRDVLKMMFFRRFTGRDEANIVQLYEELEKAQGEKITTGIHMRLTNKPLKNSPNGPEGFEESLTTHDFSLILNEYEHAVKFKATIDAKRPEWELDRAHRNAIVGWTAEQYDLLQIEALDLNPTKSFFGGSAVSKATLGTSDKVTLEKISRMKTGSMTGFNRTQTPIEGVNIDGDMWYLFLMHPDVRHDLRRDPEWANAVTMAHARGNSHPLFTGADGMWDGVVFKSWEGVTIGLDAGAGSNVPFAINHFLGKQAVAHAFGKRAEIIRETRGLRKFVIYAVRWFSDTAKPNFNGKDFGAIQFVCARSRISDA